MTFLPALPQLVSICIETNKACTYKKDDLRGIGLEMKKKYDILGKCNEY